MTEAEWMACSDSALLLLHLLEVGRLSGRKSQLLTAAFAVALGFEEVTCRRLEPLAEGQLDVGEVERAKAISVTVECLLSDGVLRSGLPDQVMAEKRRWDAIRRDASGLVRDVFPNPFRVLSIDPVWLRWSNEAVT